MCLPLGEINIGYGISNRSSYFPLNIIFVYNISLTYIIFYIKIKKYYIFLTIFQFYT